MSLQLGLSTADVITLAVIAWLALVALALAMAVVSGRAERMHSDALEEAEWLQQLADVRSPSGKPFFKTALDERLLLQSVTELRTEFSEETSIR